MSYPFSGPMELPAPSVAQHHIALSSPTNFSGQMVVGDGPGRVVLTNSHLELDWSMVLIARSDTANIFEQVEFNWLDGDGNVHPHYFDFVIKQTDGLLIAYAVRPTGRSHGTFNKVMPVIAKQALASRVYADVRHLSEDDLDPIDLSNAWLLHGMRTPDPEADMLAAAVLTQMSGVETLGTLSDRVQQGAWGFRALIRLIRSHHLRLVRSERIDMATEVYKAENVQ